MAFGIYEIDSKTQLHRPDGVHFFLIFHYFSWTGALLYIWIIYICIKLITIIQTQFTGVKLELSSKIILRFYLRLCGFVGITVLIGTFIPSTKKVLITTISKSGLMYYRENMIWWHKQWVTTKWLSYKVILTRSNRDWDGPRVADHGWLSPVATRIDLVEGLRLFRRLLLLSFKKVKTWEHLTLENVFSNYL